MGGRGLLSTTVILCCAFSNNCDLIDRWQAPGNLGMMEEVDSTFADAHVFNL